MSTDDVVEALHLLAERSSDSDFAGEHDEALVVAAEEALGISFPPSYRTFLRRLGAGSVGGAEFYGVIGRNFLDSGVPDGIWLTLRARREWDLPASMIVIYSDGMGGYFVLDSAQRDEQGEMPVLVWQPGVSKVGGKLERIAPDFGSFFLATVQRELGAH